MRIAACLIALASILMGADSPYLKLHKTTKNRTITVSAENVSGKSIVAYVVAIESSDGTRKGVHYGVYTDDDVFPAGDTVELAKVDALSESAVLTVFVDYVRLSDGTVWGDAVTEQGKEVAARFKR